jgi:hypothetical protein
VTSDRHLAGSQHSLAPWRVVKESGQRVIRGQPPGYGPRIAIVVHRVFVEGKPAEQDPEADANGSVLAAAPDLLAAAEAVIQRVDQKGDVAGSDAYAQLRAAVDAARGTAARA